MCVAAQAEGTPKIQFDQTVYDFGKTSQVATVSGVFKFKNVGDGILKLEPPKPSCGCTVAELKPDTLKPGETGELPFSLHLGQVRTGGLGRVARVHDRHGVAAEVAGASRYRGWRCVASK